MITLKFLIFLIWCFNQAPSNPELSNNKCMNKKIKKLRQIQKCQIHEVSHAPIKRLNMANYEPRRLSSLPSPCKPSFLKESFIIIKSIPNKFVGYKSSYGYLEVNKRWTKLHQIKRDLVTRKSKKKKAHSHHLKQPYERGLNFNVFISYFSNFGLQFALGSLKVSSSLLLSLTSFFI